MPTKRNSKTRRNVASFFCGCGGLDLGFLGDYSYRGTKYRRSCFDIVAAFDNDQKCISTYKDNIDGPVEQADLSNYDVSLVPRADVLIGGFPCQDFATCGPRHGLGSDRGRLYLAMVRYMREHQPKVIIGENVPGLSNIRKGSVLATIRKDIESVGYRTQVWTLHAPDYGIPQRRTRIFIVGVREDMPGMPQEPKTTFTRDTYRTIEWAIKDLEGISDESVPNQSQYFRASKAKKGNGQGDETSRAAEPSYTVRANAKSRVQFHYKLPRRLTVRECARLQTFPDDFVFGHSATTNVMQIGNAVPPVMGTVVANAIAQYLKEIEERTKK